MATAPEPPVPVSDDAQTTADATASTELWLIRHGESEGNRAGLLQGQKDYPLSARGRVQVERLGERLRPLRFDGLYCSDLERAVATAGAVAATTGLTPVIDPGLREIDIGAWSGLTPEAIHVRFPDEYTGWMRRRDPAHRRGGGESYLDLQQRIMPVVTGIARRHLGGRVAIVAHGGAINAYLCGVLGLPLDHMWRLVQDNAAINRVQPFTNPIADPGVRPGRVLSINDVLHLEPES